VSRRKFIAGNWKMNLRRDSSVALATALVDRMDRQPKVDVAVCPPSVYLHDVAAAVRGSGVALGAQNMSQEADGAFTGEISSGMLTDLGCKYVIFGHSERRQFYGETDELVNKKMTVALTAGLIPIVCVGETLAEREAGQTETVVGGQVKGSLRDASLAQFGKIVVAYEPVWAIGTGRVASPAQAEEVHAHIRKLLQAQYGDAANQLIILYGGSVKPDNAKELLHQPNIDGALVGGASLKADDFLKIIAAAG
jgi:triosephosphate isomerase (TIM)